MRILFLNYSLHAQGGSQMTSSALAQALVRRGHRVWLGGARGTMVEVLQDSGIETLDLPLNRAIPSLGTFSLANIGRIAALVRRERIDLIHAFQYLPALTAVAATTNRRLPIYLSLLGPSIPNFRVPPGLTHCFAVSEEIRRKSLLAGVVSADRLSLLPNRLDLSRYGSTQGESTLPDSVRSAPGARRVCLVSTHYPHKMGPLRSALEAMPRLAARHPDLELILAGDGPSRAEVESLARDANDKAGRRAVIVAGTLDMAATLRCFVAVIGMGRSALEAMASGRPMVIAGPSGWAGLATADNLPHLAIHNLTGRGEIATEPQSEAMFQALDRVLSDPVMAERAGREGREFVSREYDVERGAETLESHYRHALETQAGRLDSPLGPRLASFLAQRLAVAGTRRLRSALTREAGAADAEEPTDDAPDGAPAGTGTTAESGATAGPAKAPSSAEIEGISVVIPVYNGEAFIERAVRSVEAQTLPPAEIIVVDDGSTDGTLGLLEEWQRAGRIRMLRRSRGGPAAARNSGAEQARTNWIAFLDADDEFAPGALTELWEAARREPSRNWFITDVLRIRPDREELKTCRVPAGDAQDWLGAILTRNFVERGFFFRRSRLLATGGFAPIVNYFEDWDLFIRLIRERDLPGYVPLPLYRYIETDGSITRNPQMMVRVLRRVLDRHHRPLARSGDPLYRRIYARRLWGLGQDCFYRARHPLRALPYLAESLAYDWQAGRLGQLLRRRRSAPRFDATAPQVVLFVETSAYPSYGGSKRVLVQLAGGLDRSRWIPAALACATGPWVDDLKARGVSVQVTSPGAMGEHGVATHRPKPASQLRRSGVRWLATGDFELSAPRRLVRDARVHLRYLRALRTARKLERLLPPHTALIHYNSPMSGGGFAWYHLARRRGIPFVTHEHGRWRTPPRIWARIAREAGAVLCLTQERALRIRAFAGDRVRATWLPNGVPEEAFHPRRSREEVRRALGIEAGEALIITAGHLQPWKGQDLAVHAARQLREAGLRFRWILCGRVLEVEFEQELRGLIESAGLQDTVRLLGERGDLPDLFAAADVSVHTSVFPEPFGMVIVEAMAVGTPVVGPSEGGVTEIVRDGIDGRHYTPRDASSLAEVVGSLILDPALCARLGASARERARADFHLNRQVERLAEIYEGVLARGRW